MKKKKYVNLPVEELLQTEKYKELPASAKVLFVELYRLQYFGKKNGGWFFREDKEIKRDTGLSLSSITRMKNVLSVQNFIKKKCSNYEGKRIKTTDYLVIFPESLKPSN